MLQIDRAVVYKHKQAIESALIKGGPKDDLLKYKLLKPIDSGLIDKYCVTAESLESDATRIVEEDTRILQFVDCCGDAEVRLQQFARLPLSRQMAFKLTIAKEQQPHLYHHLLLVTLIAQYLAVGVALPEKELNLLLCAALFHDLGELYTDPAVMNSTAQLSETDWHHIYAHPITGYLIARDGAELDASVAIAIKQHQERLDGSGYPAGLRGTQIGGLARIVSVADVCASILGREGSNERLCTLLRLNRQKYDPKLLDLLYNGLNHISSGDVVGEIPLLPQLRAVAQLLGKWEEFSAAMMTEGRVSPPHGLEFLFERMDNLRSMSMQFGFDPDGLPQLAKLADEDAQFARELSEALCELKWQFKALERETMRRGELVHTALRDTEDYLLNCWIVELHAYLSDIG